MAGQFFDPLQAWFGIPPAEQPPDFYRLLGVRRFETDRSAIDAAYTRRIDLLSSHWRGHYRAEAKRLYGDVLAGQLCLTTSAMKASYDAALRGQEDQYQPAVAQPAPIPVTLPQPMPTAAAPSFAMDEPPRYSRSPRQSKRRKNDFLGLVMMFVGPMFGLALGYFILCAIDRQYDFLGVFAKPVQEATTRTREPTPTPPPTHIKPRVRPEFSTAPKVEPEPAPEHRPIPVPRAAFTVPQFIDLPKRDVNESLEIGHVIGDVSLALLSPKGNPLQLMIGEPDDTSGPRTWQIVAVNRDDKTTVATVEHRNDKLVVRWADNADETAECLRNCVLSINVGGQEKSVVMRTTATAAAVLIDLDDTVTVVPIECQLWGLNPKSLTLEVSVSDGPPPAQIVPADSRNPLGQPVRLLFRDKAPTAERP